MAKLTKAQITYKVDTDNNPFINSAVESVLRFHSVVAEDHSISTEITKFPVQSGFNISNHAIKKNRAVSISGVISNHLVVGSEELHEYGGNNSKIMFATLEGLVHQATPCDVVTNFGDYSPVIFTKFKTKLAAGKTDIMEFIISGEEVQVADSINGPTPALIEFKPISKTKRKSVVAKLTSAGLTVTDDAEISEATVDLREGFQWETTGTNGKAVRMTYSNVGYDPTTEQYLYEVSTSDIDVVQEEASSSMNWADLIQGNIGLEKGALTASACIKDGLIGLGTDIVEDTIDTALGNLKKTVYGAAYGIFGVNGNKEFGQVLLALGVDCIIAGAIGSVNPSLNPDDFSDNDLPTIDDILLGAAKRGDIATTTFLRASAPTTLTKISSTDSVNFLEDSL